ncbi:uncharacterized protein HMPREF1541_05288 [Cyphellophora europaea CBS 101466]|uniref:Uncharacterized protein n=1 Tax=Cyphellophora europaea (strain CBS 101466) TaxID=1220924 RepID=W2RRC4_CYPE1|nr:uncharacterized protein HMPREF1541_05288 [Cyphellophora europaea CBS 101466]ETN39066.1 hypothetical protein HMPREF1541_05288 [Cyphellophora europaea CBS 101466]
MTDVLVRDTDLASLAKQVVVITGGSSGIGLAATKLLLSLGASVVIGDVQPPRDGFHHDSLAYQQTDVTKWSDLLTLFQKAKDVHGRIDHVFANAGISVRANYLATDLDENGDLKEPSFESQEVNLRGWINTATLGMYYMRPEQQSGEGSIVITSSIAGFSRFRAVDYASAKHGNLGFMRAMHQILVDEKLPIRINAIGPSWTRTGIVPGAMMEKLGVELQEPEDAARSALILMADSSRNGQFMHSCGGRFKEIEESIFVPATLQVVGKGKHTEDDDLKRAMELMGGSYKDKGLAGLA